MNAERACVLLAVVGVLAVLAATPASLASTRTFDFDTSDYGIANVNCTTNPVPPLFNRPEYGVQTAGYIVDPAGPCEGAYQGTQGSNSLLTAFFSSSAPNSDEIHFSWVDPTNDDTWLRLPAFTSGSAPVIFGSPTVHLGVGSSIKMDITVFGTDGTVNEVESGSGGLEFALIIRETGLNLPLGEDGGLNGTVEFVGVDSVGGTTDTFTPVGGTRLNHSSSSVFSTIEWKIISTTQIEVRVNGGSPVTKSVVAFTGDGILSAANNRGTLDSVAIRKPANDDVTKKWYVNIDNLVIDAPGITDPVKVVGPVLQSATSVKVKFIDPSASTVTLYRDTGSGPQVLATATQPPEDFSDHEHVFTGLSLSPGQILTATQTVGGVESPQSAPESVLSAVVWSENFDGYATQAAFDAVWLQTSGNIDFELATDQAVSCPQSAKEPAAPSGVGLDPYRRYIDLTTVTGGQVLSVNGSDEVPLWITWYFRHGAGSNQRNYIQFRNYSDGHLATGTLGHMYHAGCYNTTPVLPLTNYSFRDYGDGAPDWFAVDAARQNNTWVKMQIKLTTSETRFYINDVETFKNGTAPTPLARFGPDDGITTIVLGSGVTNAGVPAWYDNISLSLGATATDPFGPPENTIPRPTIVTPVPIGATTVTVNNVDPTATLVKVYGNGQMIGSAAPGGQASVNVAVSAVALGTTLTATQVIGGAESCYSTAVLVALPVPTVQAPILPGSTAVTVTNIDPAATAVSVYVDSVFANSATVSGETTKVVTVPALASFQLVQASQTIGTESGLSAAVEVSGNPVGNLRLTLGLREVPTPASPAVGADGGATGSIEWLGCSAATNGPPLGKLVSPSPSWQMVTFDRTVDPALAFASATGQPAADGNVFNGQGEPWYVIEHLAISIDEANPLPGPYLLYIDSIENDGVVFGAFDSPTYAVGQEVMFRQPGFSGSTSGNIAASPSSALVSATESFAGGQSDLVQFKFIDRSLTRWVRLTTNNTAALGNPLVRLDRPVTLRILLCQATPPTIVGPVSAGQTSVTLTGVLPVANSVTVYVNGSPVNVPGNGTDTVVVTVPSLQEGQTLSATQTVGGVEGCSGPVQAVVGRGANSGLRLSVGIREASGDIEWLGATAVVDGAPQGALISPSTSWQTLSVDNASPIQPFTGDGTLNETSVVLEHLAIATDSADLNTGPFVMYIDNVKNGTTTVQDFEAAAPGTVEVLFRAPRFSGTTDQFLLGVPNEAVVDNTQGDASAQSERIEWQFASESAGNWVRLTTSGANPTVDLTQGVTLRVLLLPATTCETPAQDTDGDGDVDLADFGTFLSCFNGPNRPWPGPPVNQDKCACLDADGDTDVDLSDFSVFLSCFNGPSRPPASGCP